MSLVKIFNSYNPDVVHSHNSKTGALSRVAAYICRKAYKKKTLVIHQVHGYYFSGEKGIKNYIFKKIEVVLSRITDVLLFQNKEELELSKKLKMDRRARLEYIGNGISFEEFDKIFNETNKNIECFSKEDTLNILSIARIERVKNQKQIIEGLNILVNQNKRRNIKVYFIGEQDKSYCNELLNKVKEFGLESYVSFTGMLDRNELMEYFGKGHLSILTSIKEGKPRSLMESMYLGIPCIGTNVIGTNELIKNGFNGYLIILDNPHELAERIEYLIDNPLILKEISGNTGQYALENFDERKVIKRLLEIYEPLLEYWV
jgi:glycosyltransferase involved in cell wall biosynthesis